MPLSTTTELEKSGPESKGKVERNNGAKGDSRGRKRKNGGEREHRFRMESWGLKCEGGKKRGGGGSRRFKTAVLFGAFNSQEKSNRRKKGRVWGEQSGQSRE